jgi:hypothetical protein
MRRKARSTNANPEDSAAKEGRSDLYQGMPSGMPIASSVEAALAAAASGKFFAAAKAERIAGGIDTSEDVP